MGFDELDQIRIVRKIPYSQLQVWGKDGLKVDRREYQSDVIAAFTPHIERINADIAGFKT